jgi:hypothetical protein
VGSSAHLITNNNPLLLRSFNLKHLNHRPSPLHNARQDLLVNIDRVLASFFEESFIGDGANVLSEERCGSVGS